MTGPAPVADTRAPVDGGNLGSFLVLFGALVVLAAVVLAVAGRQLAPHDPAVTDVSSVGMPPSWSHWLGTDGIGRDVLSRVFVGARSALIGPVIVSLGAMIVGNLLGVWAGVRGGWVDAAVMRWVDLMSSMPGLLVAIVVGGVMGGGYWTAVGILVVLSIPYDTRVMRGAAMEQRVRPYVEAARLSGLGRARVTYVHVWPNVAHIAMANAFLNFAFSIVTLAGLSYLGIGVSPGTPDWGRMLAEAQPLVFQNAAAALGPGIAIALVAASMNVLGNRLAERLAARGRG